MKQFDGAFEEYHQASGHNYFLCSMHNQMYWAAQFLFAGHLPCFASVEQKSIVCSWKICISYSVRCICAFLQSCDYKWWALYMCNLKGTYHTQQGKLETICTTNCMTKELISCCKINELQKINKQINILSILMERINKGWV